MENKINISEWARLNGMTTPEEFKHEIVLIMAGIGSIDIDTQTECDTAIYKCGFGDRAYHVIVRKL